MWTVLARGGAILTFAHGAISLVEKLFAEEVLPNRIYNTVDAAHILGMSRHRVLELVSAGDITGLKVDGNYRILGSSILEYMNK